MDFKKEGVRAIFLHRALEALAITSLNIFIGGFRKYIHFKCYTFKNIEKSLKNKLTTLLKTIFMRFCLNLLMFYDSSGTIII